MYTVVLFGVFILCIIALTSLLALDFFESSDQESDVGPAQIVVPQQPRPQGWDEVN